MATEHIVKGIKYGTYQKYKNLSTKDPDFLYFITDKGGTIYKGSELVIPKNVIETVTRNAAGVQTPEQDYYNFEIELFENNSAGSTSSPTDPTKLTFSVYSIQAVRAIREVLEAALNNHRLINRTGSGTELDPYVYTYADQMAHNEVDLNENIVEHWGHVRLTDEINANEDRDSFADYDDGGGTAVTPKAVFDYVESVIGGIGGAMVFKGTLNSPSEVPSSGYEAGWTYRIGTAGTYAGQACEIGDLLIAIASANPGQSQVINAHWTVGQNNIDGAVTADNNLENNSLVVGAGNNKTVKKLTTPSNSNGYYLRIVNNIPTWTTHPNTDHGIAHCTCSTATDTAAKAATLSIGSNYKLENHAIVAVRFTYQISPKAHVPATTPVTQATLNVENTGAKPIYFRNQPIGEFVVDAGDTVTFIYDGTCWLIISIDKHLSSVATSGDYDDLSHKAIIFATNSQAANVVARELTLSDYTEDSDRLIAVKFTNGIIFSEEAYPTLSINGGTAKNIKWHGDNVQTNEILAGDTVLIANRASSYDVITIDRKIDYAPTNGSNNLITSGAVYNSLLKWESIS